MTDSPKNQQNLPGVSKRGCASPVGALQGSADGVLRQPPSGLGFTTKLGQMLLLIKHKLACPKDCELCFHSPSPSSLRQHLRRDCINTPQRHSLKHCNLMLMSFSRQLKLKRSNLSVGSYDVYIWCVSTDAMCYTPNTKSVLCATSNKFRVFLYGSRQLTKPA